MISSDGLPRARRVVLSSREKDCMWSSRPGLACNTTLLRGCLVVPSHSRRATQIMPGFKLK